MSHSATALHESPRLTRLIRELAALLDQEPGLEEQLRESSSSRPGAQMRSKVESILSNNKLLPGDYAPFVHYCESGYSKNLVHDFGGRCNLILMCWLPGQQSHFHGHEGSRCFVSVLDGQVLEQQAPYPAPKHDNNNVQEQQQLTHDQDQDRNYSRSERILASNDGIHYIDDSIGIHKVINRSQTKPAITMHFYVPAYTKCRLFEESDKLHSLATSRLIEVRFNNNKQNNN